ncbi:MAG: hypothetical protein Q7U57_14815 [Methylovulum sp.]|nr:hypothetical protein [Methylovulum sp.]
MYPFKKYTYSLILLILFSTSIATATPLKIPESYPIAMVFKASKNLKPGGSAFKKQLNEQEPYAWIHAPGPGEKSAMTRKQFPNKIITLQKAYGGISEDDFTGIWPGHLLYKAGTLLGKDISPNDNTIFVQDLNRVFKSKKRINKVNKKASLALIIYALDEKGKPDWSRAEHIIVDAVDNQKIVVKRGQWGTKPLSFQAGKAVVAPHMMFWSHQWQLNLSLDSPRGGIGNLTAAEWFAQLIAKRISDAKADGVEFDVGRWTWGYPEANPMDVNNDLIPDYGYINGVNSFGLGGQVLFRELRKIVGPDKIIQADSNDAMSGVRGWHYLNGIQMEAFPYANDYDRFSPAFLHLRLWVNNAEALPKVSYPFTKTPTTVFANVRMPDGSKTDFHFRVGFASACLVGMPHPFASAKNTKFDPANAGVESEDKNLQFGVFNWDEYHGGDLNDWHWLGRPQGPAQQELNDLDKTDLLAKASWQWTSEHGFVADTTQVGGTYSANVKQIPSGILPEKMWAGVHLAPKDGGLKTLAAGREYTLVFEAQGSDSWHYAGQNFDRVPRMTTISGAITGKAKKPLSILADSEWRTYHISFIADQSHLPTPVFGVAEQIGKTEIRNIKLYAGGAERWSREFEKGLVLLNMTNDPWRVAVRKNYYKRLKGSQAPEINNGQPVENEVIIPARDALFLVKR